MKTNNTIKLKMLIAFFLVPFLKTIAQEVQVSYFGHAGYTAKFNHEYAPNQNAFNSGGMDILISSQLTERLSAVGELFTGYRGDGANSVSLSIERLNFKYQINDFLNVRIGRMYTPLGFWQSRYSQAQFFQPTINAPYAVRTKYDKGLIPTNSVGLQIDGENIGKLRFGYYLMIDNSSGAPSLNTDNTDFKALTGKLKIEPIENLEIFASGRYDEIAKGSISLQGLEITETTRQSIYNVGLVHIAQGSKWEYAAEYYRVVNDMEINGVTENNFVYAYLGYKIKKFTPYIQPDLLRFDKRDQYFEQNNLDGLVVGARYSFSPSSVIKLEYKYRSTEHIGHQDVLSLQIAARF